MGSNIYFVISGSLLVVVSLVVFLMSWVTSPNLHSCKFSTTFLSVVIVFNTRYNLSSLYVTLSFSALNSNKLTGKIPATLGKLSNLYWLDVADNQLTGSIPVSTDTSPGLDLLLIAKHL